MALKKAVKKTPAKKPVAKASKKCSCPAKAVVVKKPFGKAEIVRNIAEMSCLSKKDAAMAMDALLEIIECHLKKRAPGEFTLPGVAKFRVMHKPATKARQGVNPFTGAPMTFAAKPARNVIKVRPLKKIKDIAK